MCVYLSAWRLEAKPFTVMWVTFRMGTGSGRTLPVTAGSSVTEPPLGEPCPSHRLPGADRKRLRCRVSAPVPLLTRPECSSTQEQKAKIKNLLMKLVVIVAVSLCLMLLVFFKYEPLMSFVNVLQLHQGQQTCRI